MRRAWSAVKDFSVGPGLVVTIALVFSAIAILVQAAPSGQPTVSAETLFQSKCVGCHSIGGGVLVGPDLKNISNQRSRDWLVNWIMAPDDLIARKDPIAVEIIKQYPVQMPNLGLSRAESEAILSYIDAQSGGASSGGTPALLPGNAERGKEFFTGAKPFQNGGPPCLACHSIGGIGALGGGALGPDLTPAFNKFGETTIASLLATVPAGMLPTMNPIYTDRPLTAAEQADLRVFLQQANVIERPFEALGPLILLAVLGAIVLLVVAQLIWRRRLEGVRRPLVERQRSTMRA